MAVHKLHFKMFVLSFRLFFSLRSRLFYLSLTYRAKRFLFSFLKRSDNNFIAHFGHNCVALLLCDSVAPAASLCLEPRRNKEKERERDVSNSTSSDEEAWPGSRVIELHTLLAAFHQDS